MKFVIITLVSIVFSFQIIQAAENTSLPYSLRSAVDESLAPFYHGVASGDPTPNAVIIWTRVTTEDLAGTVNGTWRMATDTLFNNVVQSGTFTTDSTRDFTVKIDVTGLQPYSWYFYEFIVDGKHSLTGRTKTAPVGGVDQLRFAFVSCSNYVSGYFNGYDRIWERNDIDAVLHLGDYIYENNSGYLFDIRTDQEPQKEIITLEDYRLRHSTYKLDKSLMRLHQQFPFICVWDDHETTNNSYTTGADNHTPSTEGSWDVRKHAAQVAYDEWIPIRYPESDDINKIWRKKSYGDLADVFMLDTRLYDRDKQNSDLINDTSRHLLGPEQLNWLKNELINSTATWKILAQQVMMGQLNPFGIVLNDDQWDGYQAERKRLYDIILDNNIQNVIVLTGDIHTAWAMDLPYNQNNYNKNTGQGSVAVEFVTTSISSPASPIPLPPVYQIIKTILPHIKYVDLSKKGYGLLNLEPTQAQADFYSVPRVDQLNPNQRWEAGYYTDIGTRWIRRDTVPTQQIAPKMYYAPFTPLQEVNTGIKPNNNDFIVLSIYPNPVQNDLFIQYNLKQSTDVNLLVYDIGGKQVINKNLGYNSAGLHNIQVDLDHLANGAYKVVLQSKDGFIEKTVEKM
ncbi:MAG: alkaline phosphatase D family protein [Chitinophagales bacterium]|nr:alkaline phosphatase D family protein [Chitinophagales bacterium]